MFRRNGLWYSDVRIGGKRIRKKLHKDKKMASLINKNLETELIRTGATELIQCTTAVEKHIMAIGGASERQKTQVGKRLGWLIDFCNITYISEFSPGLCQSYINSRGHCATPTLNIEKQSIKRFFEFCIDMDWIRHNPARLLKRQRDRRKIKRFSFSDDQLKYLFDIDCDYRDFWMFLLETGLRCTDTWELHSNQIKDGWVSVFQRKTSDWIQFPLNESARRLIEGRRGPIFPIMTKGFHQRQSLTLLKTVDRRATHHSFRHTFSLKHLNNGTPKEILQAFLGHKSVTTTEIYANYINKDILLKYI